MIGKKAAIARYRTARPFLSRGQPTGGGRAAARCLYAGESMHNLRHIPISIRAHFTAASPAARANCVPASAPARGGWGRGWGNHHNNNKTTRDTRTRTPRVAGPLEGFAGAHETGRDGPRRIHYVIQFDESGARPPAIASGPGRRPQNASAQPSTGRGREWQKGREKGRNHGQAKHNRRDYNFQPGRNIWPA
ncbi:Hypothetical predicted protein [Olea europaea subsp. europaea]|uniref:Uncharacterized protein n=1 Tax=Olea europaea subsp. europaea TaxID=158383 RepID=A0A8S0Q5J6_OLEEU|nr:Hypothetical predicted protein [Olea europaea subsp. europaea]